MVTQEASSGFAATNAAYAYTQIAVSFVLLVITTTPVHAAFTREAHWRLDAIVQYPEGTWCFAPGPSVAALSCTDTTLAAVAALHINNTVDGFGHSVAYYLRTEVNTLSILGGATWNEGPSVVNGSVVIVCLSGEVSRSVLPTTAAFAPRRFKTECRYAHGDDDHDTASAHTIECVWDQPQQLVLDGCYDSGAKKRGFKIGENADDVFAIVGIVFTGLTLVWWCVMRLHNVLRRRRRHRAEDSVADDAIPLADVARPDSVNTA